MCQPSSTTECSPYLCSDSVCGSTCTSDTDCAANAWCRTSDHTCQPDQPKGGTCTKTSQCQSGNCADGFCCDTACAGICQACSAATKGTGQDGDCGSIAGGSDPDNECNDQGSTSCGTNGSCSGLGSCALYPQGTACGVTTCQGGTQTGQACNGSGGCVPATTSSCAPYTCAGAACASTCQDDSQCVAAYFCKLSDHTCQPDQANGMPCTAGAQCASGSCVDGVCCDTACQGSCEVCSAAKKGKGDDGACGAVVAGSDPDNECDADGPASCGHNGSCDGSGACALYASGTPCGTTSCTQGLQTGQACNGSGTCLTAVSTPCAPFTCAGSVCASDCKDDTDCIESHHCDLGTGACVADLDKGGTCTSGAECKTGHCVDGVCCDTTCASTCQACSAVKKGDGDDGDCGNVVEGQDPDGECDDQGPSTCGYDGACNGIGACRFYAAGVSCGDSTCLGNVAKGAICNGLGSCVTDSGGADCSPYLCSGAGCSQPCATDDNCIQGYYCAAGTCLEKGSAGDDCIDDAGCGTGHCVDGVCCTSTCDGQCEACDQAGNVGTCVAVTGAPVGNRPSCAGTGTCAGTCDGTNRVDCTYPGAAVACGSVCAQGTLTASACDAQGRPRTLPAGACAGVRSVRL